LLAALLSAAPCETAGARHAHGHAKLATTKPEKPQEPAAPPLETIPDLNKAVPARDIGKLPTTAQQYQALKTEIGKERPQVESAKTKSDKLHAEAAALQQKLIDTAARVQSLEAEKISLDSDIANLSLQEKTLAASFARDRVSVARLLAVLERLQHDVPPAMAVKPDDALGAARGAMLIGASLPQVYGAASELVRRIEALKETRDRLIERQAEAQRNTLQLSAARTDLNQLLAIKQIQSRDAASEYAELATQLMGIAARASTLKSLLDKVSALRAQPVSQDVVVVSAESRNSGGRAAFLKPVVGNVVNAEAAGMGPGLTIDAMSGAQVISPTDGKVLFSGPYHKYGHVLILKTSLGYDAVLAGLDRVDVRPEDQVLAGEPVGTMPRTGTTARLYFELRQNGRGIDPAPFLTLELRKAKKT
jgi:septal ring factor EnvC (AmiA/AmiB activator)